MDAGRSALTEDQLTLLSALPRDGSSVSNPSLRHFLKWKLDRYFAARDALVDMGLVSRGPGKGGVVRRVQREESDETPVASALRFGQPGLAAAEGVFTSEPELYEPMRAVIEDAWARDHRQDLLAVETTALAAGHNGIWTRPDIASVELRTFQYVPGKHLEVNTFEVKGSWAVNVQAVYEALAHRRAATRSYVLLHVPRSQALALAEAVAEVADAAREHGIGLVTAGDPCDYETWDEVAEARRVEPDPERLNQFIARQFSEPTRSLIATRLR
ncbi:hypothetical protein U2F26_05490 [Micromonospora sp. 4G57]|uniref:Uncharacterized protein n=1 Tax=Micromonospora sicca TaxID=2202420 RepID=A0ABU5JHN3_9ACTN|nr:MULTISPECIES: hypothetical protein [unclassified Micromonospora]MDZ5442188.1 hypothetical protein [Micromonospora sp. 4G57]MDZ5492135.1 hypothetical protein [Micromonospora sp. 4G53]